jgi:hypothetical protein
MGLIGSVMSQLAKQKISDAAERAAADYTT